MLALVTLLALTSPQPPLEVLVIVPLCDSAHLACGNGALGDPHDPAGNLYWGAMYGAFTFLQRTHAYDAAAPTTADGVNVLQERVLMRRAQKGERAVRVTLRAYDGEKIDGALRAYLEAIAHHDADLVVWVGHDRLMDVSAPVVAADTRTGTPANAAVLACSSETYFRPALDALGARTIALTKSFMAPEGYLVDALLANVARHGVDDRAHLREALVAAYAKYQRISSKAAATVFSTLE